MYLERYMFGMTPFDYFNLLCLEIVQPYKYLELPNFYAFDDYFIVLISFFSVGLKKPFSQVDHVFHK